MAIKNTALTTVASNVYVSSGNSVITTVHICNYGANPIQTNVYVVPSGLTANSLTVIYGNVTVSPYNTLIIYQEKLVLANGDAIMANVSANSTASATVSSMGF